MKRIFACIGFSFALSLFFCNLFGASFAAAAAAPAAGVFVFSLLYDKLRREMFVGVCFGSALLGCLLFLVCYDTVALPQLQLEGISADAVFYLTDSGTRGSKGYTYGATVTQLAADGAPQMFKIRLFSEKKILAECYELIGGSLRFQTLADSGFDSYGEWGKGVFVRAVGSDLQRTGEFVRSPMARIEALRRLDTERFLSLVGGDAGALGIGFLTGDRSRLSASARYAFQMTGTAHLTAVSGLHLGAVTGVLGWTLRKIGVKAKYCAPILLVPALFYVLFSGCSKSVIRAAVMLGVMLLSSAFGKRGDALNSLGLALFLICLNPFAVCDISTLMTATCVLAIVGVYPLLTRDMHIKVKVKKRTVARDALAGAVSAVGRALLLSATITVCTLPVMCLFFGYYSAVGILLNVIIIPLGSIVVCCNLFGALLFAVGCTGAAVFVPLQVCNNFILRLITAAADIPLAGIALGSLFTVLLALVLAAVAVANLIAFDKLKQIAVTLTAALLLFSVVYAAYDSCRPHIYVAPGGVCAVCTRDGTYVCGVDDAADVKQIERYLGTRVRKIDCIIADDSASAKELAAHFDCHDIRRQSEDFEIEKNTVSLSCRSGTVYAKVSGISLMQGNAPASGQNIIIQRGKVYDVRGVHAADDGLIYTVYHDFCRVTEGAGGVLT